MGANTNELVDGMRSRARPLSDAGALDGIVDRARSRRYVAIGEASHGTHEFYVWRATLTRRLIVEAGATWIGVEGDWPDCWRIDRWVRGLAEGELDARGVLAPFDEDPHRYAWNTRMVPSSCEDDVVGLLVEVRRGAAADGDDAFNALQNATIAVEAERYYRAMVRTDRGSWNIRDLHMADTIERVATHLGSQARGVLWAHNTHIGDARATTMAEAGLLNLGQLLRERHGQEHVMLVGMASYEGEVMAARAWGAAEERMRVPTASEESHEGLIHRALGEPSCLDFGDDRNQPWLRLRAGHRAIGVVYDPANERGNCEPTVMGERYDALLWFEATGALQALHHEPEPEEAEYETEPTGF